MIDWLTDWQRTYFLFLTQRIPLRPGTRDHRFVWPALKTKYALVTDVGLSVVRPSVVCPVVISRKLSKTDPQTEHSEVGTADSVAAFRSPPRRPWARRPSPSRESTVAGRLFIDILVMSLKCASKHIPGHDKLITKTGVRSTVQYIAPWGQLLWPCMALASKVHTLVLRAALTIFLASILNSRPDNSTTANVKLNVCPRQQNSNDWLNCVYRNKIEWLPFLILMLSLKCTVYVSWFMLWVYA